MHNEIVHSTTMCTLNLIECEQQTEDEQIGNDATGICVLNENNVVTVYWLFTVNSTINCWQLPNNSQTYTPTHLPFRRLISHPPK